MDSDPLSWIDERLLQLRQAGRERHPTVRRSPQSPRGILLGDRELLNFGSNDYLGLAAELSEAAVDAISSRGWGSGASPLLGGRSDQHAALENELAGFLGCEAALVFPTGFAANVGCLTALAGAGDVIYSDSLNHASIIDGCRLSKARVEIYPHADVEQLDVMLRRQTESGRRLVVTDTLFSMHGDAAPLDGLAEVARRHGAMLMVDEAHATGVFGAEGRGLCEQFGVVPDIHVGTLSKALGSHGGFVAGRRSLIQWLYNVARPYFFSTAAPAANAAAARAALRLIQSEPQRRQHLLNLASQLRAALAAAGWRAGGNGQIVPIHVGDSHRTMRLADKLLDSGIYAPGIRPPSVPEGESLLRVSVSAAHTESDIERLLTTLTS